MATQLQIDYAACSEAGDKPENADAADARVPTGRLLRSKGIAAVIADGVSSSAGAKLASQVCVTGFLTDYFCTPESWTVKTSVAKVLGATNSWLYSQSQTHYGSAQGMLSTCSGLVIKSTTAHIFHVGDSRIYHYRDGHLELLTRDHQAGVGGGQVLLSRAMGADPHLEIDYKARTVECGAMFLFTSDGVTNHLSDNRLAHLLDEHQGDLKACVNAMVEEALRNGSDDNVTCQLLKIISLAVQSEDDILHSITELPFPPALAPGIIIDGYELLSELHASSRSEVFLALDTGSESQVVLKTPSLNYRDDPAYLEGFLHEEWIAKRLKNIHVLKFLATPRRRFLYNISEYVPGITLRQWIDDHPTTDLKTARELLGQLAAGLRAFHRLEMVHLDLKPDNILIDKQGVLKIIDFGSTHVAGATEITATYNAAILRGTANYSAPECATGVFTYRADIFSLGVIAYELLTGALPYGVSDHAKQPRRKCYISACSRNLDLAPWIDGALHKSVHPDPDKRYGAMSEFLYDLAHPNPALLGGVRRPLLSRNPLRFWKFLALVLGLFNILLLILLGSGI